MMSLSTSTDTGLGFDDDHDHEESNDYNYDDHVGDEDDVLDETAPETDYFKMMMADNQMGRVAANGNAFRDDHDGTDGESIIGGATIASMLQNNRANDVGGSGDVYRNYDAMSVDSYGYSLAQSNVVPPGNRGLVIATGNGDVEVDNDNDNETSLGVVDVNVDVERTTLSIVGVDPDDDVSTIANDTINPDTRAFFTGGHILSSTPRVRLFKEYTTPEKRNKTSNGGNDADDATAPETPPGMTIRVPASSGDRRAARGSSVRSGGGGGGGGSITSKMSTGNILSSPSNDKTSGNKDLPVRTTLRSKRVYIVAGILAVILCASIIALGVALGGIRNDDGDDGDASSSASVSAPPNSTATEDSQTVEENVLNDWPELGDSVLDDVDPVTPAPVEQVVAVPTNAPVQVPTPVVPTVVPLDPAVVFQDMITILDSRGVSTAFQDSETSPQFQGLQWLSNDPSYTSFSEERAVQRWVLAVLAYSLEPTTLGAGRRNLEIAGWLAYTDECTWFSSTTGIAVCDTNGLYQNIDIQDMNLGGFLPSELGLLSNSLRSINLDGNSIQGQIPPEIGDLTLLESLRLRQNRLDQAITGDIGRLSNLALLDLGLNQIPGPIPDSVGDMSSLRVLALDFNELTGEIPGSIGDLSTSLVELRINNNFLGGQLPNELSRLDQLQILMIGNNSFDGQLPRNFCQLEELEVVSVDCQSLGVCECCTECSITAAPTASPVTSAPVCADSVSVSVSCVEPGDAIAIGISNCNAQDDDWVGIYRVDQDINSLPNPAVWSWACGSRSCRQALQSNNFALDETHAGGGLWPLDEGTYMVVMARNSAQPYQAFARSQSFTVQDSC